jgi:sarcosine oxidase delta subunit
MIMNPKQKCKIDQAHYDRNKDIADNKDDTYKEYLYQKPKKDQIKNYR